ncbi:MAG: helix-hairpin-helix domain-containing protein [Bacteroidales bacterium]|jgi:competence protein ComEA|nr:helix-hairpin-helix domain-containing protein [Bacteroidales bacterium]MDD2687749.1 helix-hairpin-helix domain-containing protein [Bacteroidales bacterium]MDD3330027.1 helix-hairpin-helix domain-containing protein [Bacteroidales bacterium]MDD3690833.1 helix-hairpin-helix domain-containing protein [Bacteroidales bacterium]MDD4044121.1 helix-hairpin-helix domain-containing protein [Bacteroidales bacterium]
MLGKRLWILLCQWVDLTHSERRGFLILFTIFFIIIAVRISSKFIFSTSSLQNITEEEKIMIQSFYERQKQLSDSFQKASMHTTYQQNFNFYNVNQSVAEQILKPFPFNPNQLPIESWKKIGLTDQQIKNIKNYEAKGGVFRTKEDLRKMYSISEATYNILEPYIIIPTETGIRNSQNHHTVSAKHSRSPSLPKMEINQADSFDLMKIPGIGSKTAHHILLYRKRLGGFSRLEQLLEVYSIDSNRYHHIKQYLCVDCNAIEKININTASLKELIKHPYIDYYLAKTICMCREKQGPYVSLDDMKNQTKLYETLFEKIKPYLTL